LERIGPYRILESIGQGSTSHVYKGYDEALRRFVAVKTISGPALGDETVRRRFEREAQAAAGLSHPNIVTVFDFGTHPGGLYMSMELLEGTDLKQAIEDGKLERLEDRLEVMAQIARGVAFAHGQGIVHRDLKPANIRLLPNGHVKILDFGLARVSGSDMTRTGLVIGTPHYMSPEQVRGERVDARCDVFALGCLLYELTTGSRPFDADTLHAVFYKVLSSEPVPAGERVPDLPRVIDEILAKALAKAAENRFADASEFAHFLDQAREAIAEGRGHEPLRGLAPEKTATSGVRREQRPAGAAGGLARRAPWLGLAGTTAIVLAAGWFLVRRPPASVPGANATQDRAGRELTRDIVDTRVTLARRRLEAGDYAGAAREAESALRFDAESGAARETVAKAQDALARIERAVTETQAGIASRDADRARDAYWELLMLAPQLEVVGELAGALEGGFRARAEEARLLMKGARATAQAEQATLLESFQHGVASGDAGEAAFRDRRFASAAREFMKARGSFERARPAPR
jgi:tRNA A-37 threonylcarbamoyl transferase component Bud32